MNEYQKEALIKRAPQEALIAVMQGRSDDFPQWMAMAELTRRRQTGIAVDGVKAQQALAQGKQSVKDRMLSEMLPEDTGIGQLPAPNMDALAAAQGGVVGYADGGSVASYQMGGYVDPYEEWLATQSNVPARGSFWPGLADAFTYSSDVEAQKKRQQQAAQPAVAPAAAPAAAGVKPVKAPEGVKKALAKVSQPAVPVENPTKEQKETLVEKYKSADELYNFISEKFKGQLNPIKEQLDRDREAYKSMKSENVGLALLGAAGALLKPGRSTASAIGEGLGTLAEYGSKFQPQLLAARQGISAGEVGLAQAQAQAARGNFSTAMQAVGQERTRELAERELTAKEKLMAQQGLYYGAAAGAKSGAGGLTTAMQLKINQQASKAWEDYLKNNIKAVNTPAARDAFIARERQRILSDLGYGGGESNLNAGFIGGKDVTGKAYRSSLFDD